MIGYNIILNQAEIDVAATMGIVVEPAQLLSESVLNGSIIMILITCTIASFQTQRGAKNIAIAEAANTEPDDDDGDERILIPISNLETVEE